MISKWRIFFLCLLCASALGCKREKMTWLTDLQTPIAFASLSISDLLGDSLIKVNDQGTLELSYDYPFAPQQGLAIKVPDTSYTKNATIQTIQLGQRVVQRQISLGQLAKGIGPAGQIIILSNGQKRVVPPLTNLQPSAPLEISLEESFDEIELSQGLLTLRIDNGFPIDITDMIFTLGNKDREEVIVSDTIPLIKAKGMVVKQYNVAGKVFTSNLEVNITSMNSPGSGITPVLIDTSDALKFTLTASGLKLTRGVAIFPRQSLVNDQVDVVYDLGDARLTKMTVNSGGIVVAASSTIPETVRLRYEVPKATKNGSSFLYLDSIPPGSLLVPQSINRRIPLDGFDVDLRGQNGDKFNTFFNVLQMFIDSTGRKIELSQSQGVNLTYGLKDIIPQYAEGYLGQMEVQADDTLTIDAFKTLSADSIQFTSAELRLVVKNYVGAPAMVSITKLAAKNSKTGKSLALSAGQTLTLGPAINKLPTPTIGEIVYTEKNSNIAQLLSLLPDQMEFSGSFTLNPAGTIDMTQFIYPDQTLEAVLQLRLGIDGTFTNLQLSDTMQLTVAASEEVEALTLHLHYQNNLPVSALIWADALNRNDKLPLLSGWPVMAKADGSVAVDIPTEKLKALQRDGRIALRAVLSSTGINKFSSTDRIDIKASGRFQFTVIQ